MRIIPLGSGSAGNSYYVESDGTAILVDAGFGPREAERRLKARGASLADVAAIIITHEHYDHIRGAEPIAKKRQIPIRVTAGTLEASRLDPSVVPVSTFTNNTSFRVGEIEVHARRTLHDAADPACFVLEARDGTRAGFASDLGHVDEPVAKHLANCDALFFESNHDLDMLRTGSYPWSLKRRIMSRLGHLSNDDSIAALRRIVGAELKTLCMIHLSERNNHESIVRMMAAGMLAEMGHPADLMIAGQREPGETVEVARRAIAPPVAQSGQLRLFGI